MLQIRLRRIKANVCPYGQSASSGFGAQTYCKNVVYPMPEGGTKGGSGFLKVY
jgi:hypothetical protein